MEAIKQSCHFIRYIKKPTKKVLDYVYENNEELLEEYYKIEEELIEKFGTDRFEDTDEFRKLKKLVDMQAKEIEGMSEVEFEKFVKPLKKEQHTSQPVEYWGFKKLRDCDPKNLYLYNIIQRLLITILFF